MSIANVPVLTGHSPLTLGWFWSQHNEHRVFLSRLILVGLFRLTHDFRAGMYFNVLLLAIASASMVLLARRLRGRTSFTDAVFPIALLHVGQAEVFLLGFAMNLLLPAWISYELIRTAATSTDRPGSGLILRFGLCLLALPLCGGNGLVMLPPLALWLIGWIIGGWWSGRRAGVRDVAMGLAILLASSALVALYLHGYQRPLHHPRASSLSGVMVTTLEFLSQVICPTVIRFWEFTSLAVVLLILFTIAHLIVTGWRTPEERPRAAGLLLTILSLLTVALAVGVGRSGFGRGMGFSSRYLTLAAPILVGIYVTWIVYGAGRIGRVIQFGLFVLVCLSLPSSISAGGQYGKDRRDLLKRVEYGLKGQVPGARLVAATGERIMADLGLFYHYMEMLRSAGVGHSGCSSTIGRPAATSTATAGRISSPAPAPGAGRG